MSTKGRINFGFEQANGPTKSRRESFAEAVKTAEDVFTPEEKTQEIRSVKKNLTILYVTNILIAGPMYSLINSSSSLLADSGVGITSLSVLGAMQLLAAVVVGSYATKVWGVKKIVTLSYVLTVLYILSFFYPRLEMAVVGGAVMGLGYTLLITCIFMYGNMLGLWYGCVAKCDLDAVLVLTSGTVTSSLAFGIVLGDGLYYYILDPGSQIIDTANLTEEAFEICGANYCNQDLSNMTTMRPPAPWRYYTLIGVFTAMGIVGVLLSLFLEDFSSRLGYPVRKKSEFLLMLKETWMLLKDRRGYLLIVITLFVGMEEAFVLSEFTRAYVSCVIGIPKVGMLGFGATGCISSLMIWVIVKYCGRVPLVGLTIAVFMGCFITLTTWQPHPDHAVVFYVIAALWGFCDASILSVVFSVYGLLFEDNIEGSFAVGNFWFSLGYLISFGWSSFLCIYVRLIILITFACVGTMLYVILEVLNRKNGSMDIRSTIAAELSSTLPMVLPPNFGSTMDNST